MIKPVCSLIHVNKMMPCGQTSINDLRECDSYSITFSTLTSLSFALMPSNTTLKRRLTSLL